MKSTDNSSTVVVTTNSTQVPTVFSKLLNSCKHLLLLKRHNGMAQTNQHEPKVNWMEKAIALQRTTAETAKPVLVNRQQARFPKMGFKTFVFGALLLSSLSLSAQTVGGTTPGDDFDGDGIINSIDLDDDNDGILDTQEQTGCSPVDFAALTFTGGATITKTATTATVSSANPLGWKTSYSDQALKLPIHLEYTTTNPTTYAMIGLLPVAGAKTPDNWTDGAYKVYHEAGLLFGKLPLTTWNFQSVAYTANQKMEMDISTSGWVTVKKAGVVLYQFQGAVSDYNLALGAANSARTFSDIKITTADFPNVCTDIDTDNDGRSNRLDVDSDGDGCSDAIEAGTTTDTTANFKFTTTVGTNGLVDSKETTADNGIYNGTYTYNYATSSTIKACTDTDNDGITDLIDLDDDNDGVLDWVEQKDCIFSAYDLAQLNFTGNITVNKTATSIAVTGNNASWRSSYSNEALALPIHLEYTTGTAGYAMIGLLPVAGNKTVNDWIDDAYKVYNDDAIIRGKLPLTSWNINNIAYAANQKIEMDISSTGWVTVKSNGVMLYQFQGTVSNYYLALSAYSTRTYSNLKLTTGTSDKSCTNIDTDGDGTPNHLDLDSDGDGCSDAFEAGTTTDKTANFKFTTTVGTNGFANELETTTESGLYKDTYYYSDAISNSVKPCTDTDADGIIDQMDIDDDNDGILDTVECSGMAYKVYTYNRPEAGFVTNVPVIIKGISTTNAVLDQRTNAVAGAANSFSANGVTTWKLVAENIVPSRSNTIAVTLAPTASTTGSFLIADAMLVTNGVNTIFIDNNTTGYSATGSWLSQSVANSFNGANQYIGAPFTTAVTATWNFTVPAATCTDTDGDGTANYLDLDSDGDGCSDAYEAGTTTDKTANFQFTTTVGTNGLADSKETTADNGIYNGTYTNDRAINASVNACIDTDNDGVSNLDDLDDDNDGVLDNVECPEAATLSKYTVYTYNRRDDVNLPTNLPVRVTGSTVTNVVLNQKVAGTFNYGGVAWTVLASNVSADANKQIKIQTLPVTGTTNGTYYFADAMLITNGTETYIINDADAGFSKAGTWNPQQTGVAGNYSGDLYYGNIATANTATWTLDNIGNPAFQCDVDGDGVFNHLDLDTDGDGCSDALEAGTVTSTSSTTVAAPYGANGFADSKETASESGQYSAIYTYRYAKNAAINACIDTDSDGIRDVIDIDDDNDGVVNRQQKVD